MFSAKVEQLPQSVERMQAQMIELQRELNAMRREQARAQAAGLAEKAEDWNGVKVVSGVLPALLPDALRELASGLIGGGGVVALLASPKESGGYLTLFARSADVTCDVGKLLKGASAACGGKGGGKSDFAQGSAPTEAVLAEARKLLGL